MKEAHSKWSNHDPIRLWPSHKNMFDQFLRKLIKNRFFSQDHHPVTKEVTPARPTNRVKITREISQSQKHFKYLPHEVNVEACAELDEDPVHVAEVGGVAMGEEYG